MEELSQIRRHLDTSTVHAVDHFVSGIYFLSGSLQSRSVQLVEVYSENKINLFFVTIFDNNVFGNNVG